MSNLTPHPITISTAELATIQELRRRGFAVVIWAPDELGKANPRLLERFVVGSASDYIDDENRQEN